MKKIYTAVFTLLLIVLCFTGCKKDKEERVNYFQVGDKTYVITHGDLEYYGTATNGYDIGLNLLTSGITLDADGYWKNTGTGVYLDLISSANDGVTTGTYKFDGTYPAFSIYEIEYCLSWTEDYETNDWVYVESGTVTIKRTGDDYVVNLSGVDEDGHVVKGNFSGTFDMYDFSSKKGRVSSHK